MYNFTYHRPTGLRRAGNMLTKLEDAKLLAGGQTLIPVMKQRLASPANIIDLNRIDGLSGIELKGRSIVIGAMTRHVEVGNSDVVRQNLQSLAELAEMVRDPEARHMRTLGGSNANNAPNADFPSACIGLGATIITTKRRIPADDFFKGLFETALEPAEIITKVNFPLAKKAGSIKFRNPASRFALVGVFVSKRGSDIRVAAFEEALKKRFAAKSLDGLTVPATGLASDIHGSAEYRAHLIGVLAKRAVAKATA